MKTQKSKLYLLHTHALVNLFIYTLLHQPATQQYTDYEHNWQYASAIVKYQELPEDDLI